MNFSNLPPMHPAIVHFPIALVFISFICDLLGRILKNDSLRSAGWWSLVFAAIGGVITVPLGYFDMSRAMLNEDTHEYVDLHLRIGWVLLIAVALLTVWRGKYRYRSEFHPSRFYLFTAFLVTGLTLFQGWFGGEMVYSHGAGVAPTQQGTETASEAKKSLATVKEALNRVPGLRQTESEHLHASEIRESAGAAKTNETHEHDHLQHEHESHSEP